MPKISFKSPRGQCVQKNDAVLAHTIKYSIGLCGLFPLQFKVRRPARLDLKHHWRTRRALAGLNLNLRAGRTCVIFIEDTDLDSDGRKRRQIGEHVAHLSCVTLHPGTWVLRGGVDDVVNLLYVVLVAVITFPILDLEGKDITVKSLI